MLQPLLRIILSRSVWSLFPLELTAVEIHPLDILTEGVKYLESLLIRRHCTEKDFYLT